MRGQERGASLLPQGKRRRALGGGVCGTHFRIRLALIIPLALQLPPCRLLGGRLGLGNLHNDIVPYSPFSLNSLFHSLWLISHSHSRGGRGGGGGTSSSLSSPLLTCGQPAFIRKKAVALVVSL